MSNFRVRFGSSNQNIVLKNDADAGIRLDTLSDVNTSLTSANGSILVYDKTTNTYVLQDILTYDVDSGAYKLDGGDGF